MSNYQELLLQHNRRRRLTFFLSFFLLNILDVMSCNVCKSSYQQPETLIRRGQLGLGLW